MPSAAQNTRISADEILISDGHCSAPQEIDLLSYHLYPDFSILCDLPCQLNWTRQHVRGRLIERSTRFCIRQNCVTFEELNSRRVFVL